MPKFYQINSKRAHGRYVICLISGCFSVRLVIQSYHGRFRNCLTRDFFLERCLDNSTDYVTHTDTNPRSGRKGFELTRPISCTALDNFFSSFQRVHSLIIFTISYFTPLHNALTPAFKHRLAAHSTCNF